MSKFKSGDRVSWKGSELHGVVLHEAASIKGVYSVWWDDEEMFVAEEADLVLVSPAPPDNVIPFRKKED